jgi:hypothetical protein
MPAAIFTMPPAILKLADAYLESLPLERRPKDQQRARARFVRAFFLGITIPASSPGSSDDEYSRGFKTGQEYRRANPDKIKETFESFGNVVTEAEGVWTTGFEHSGFEPRGPNSNHENWWLWTTPDTVYEPPEGRRFFGRGATVHVTGFLSPKGTYGHLGAYDRDFYATRISEADGG